MKIKKTEWNQRKQKSTARYRHRHGQLLQKGIAMGAISTFRETEPWPTKLEAETKSAVQLPCGSKANPKRDPIDRFLYGAFPHWLRLSAPQLESLWSIKGAWSWRLLLSSLSPLSLFLSLPLSSSLSWKNILADLSPCCWARCKRVAAAAASDCCAWIIFLFCFVRCFWKVTKLCIHSNLQLKGKAEKESEGHKERERGRASERENWKGYEWKKWSDDSGPFMTFALNPNVAQLFFSFSVFLLLLFVSLPWAFAAADVAVGRTGWTGQEQPCEKQHLCTYSMHSYMYLNSAVHSEWLCCCCPCCSCCQYCCCYSFYLVVAAWMHCQRILAKQTANTIGRLPKSATRWLAHSTPNYVSGCVN